MNKMNFDSLTNIKAPQHFIDNALNVPQIVQAEKKQKKPLLFFKHSRTLAAVACIVFVSILSVVLYLSSDRTTPQVDPDRNTQSVATVNETSVSQTQNEGTENKENGNAARPTQPHTAIEPTEESASNKPTQGENQAPTQSDTQNPSDKPSNPNGDSSGSGNPYDEPSEPGDPLAPPPEVVYPTEEGGWVDPTEGYGPPATPTYNIYFSALIPSEKLFDGIIPYCSVYDLNDNILGDSNLYSSQHQAYFYNYSADEIFVQYELEYEYFTTGGKYIYHFYDQYGNTLYRGTKFIS